MQITNLISKVYSFIYIKTKWWAFTARRIKLTKIRSNTVNVKC